MIDLIECATILDESNVDQKKVVLAWIALCLLDIAEGMMISVVLARLMWVASFIWCGRGDSKINTRPSHDKSFSAAARHDCRCDCGVSGNLIGYGAGDTPYYCNHH